MNALSLTTAALDGDAIEHAGIELAPDVYTPVPEILPGGTKSAALGAKVASVISALGEYRHEAEIHNIADHTGGPDFAVADERWQAYIRRLEDTLDDITEVPAQSFEELHEQIGAYLRAQAAACTRRWRDVSLDEAIDIVQDASADEWPFVAVAKTVAEALPRLMKARQSPAIAAAHEKWRTSYEAFNAAIDASTAIERRIFAGELSADDLGYLASEAAQREACHLQARAWADLMETPVESGNREDLLVKLIAYTYGDRRLPSDTAVVYPNDDQIDDDAAAARLAADIERADAAPAPHPDQDVIDAAEAYIQARTTWAIAYRDGEDPDADPAVEVLGKAESAAYARLAAMRATTPEGIVAMARALHAYAPNGDVPVMPDDLVTALAQSAGATPATPPQPCPVAALIPEYERLTKAELVTADSGATEASREAGDARDDLAVRIVELKPRTTVGAALQVAIAIEYSDLARGCEQQADRDYYQDLCERLLHAALGVIGGGLSEHLWFFHVGEITHRPWTQAQHHRHHEAIGTLTNPSACGRFTAARAAYVATKAAYDALDAAGLTKDEDDPAQPVWSAMCDALEAWEATPPPSVEAMAEVMRASLAFNGLNWSWHDIDCPMSMRDFLDGGDTHSIFALRFYMHTLRLAGISSGALETPPIAGLYPKYDWDLSDEGAVRWRLFHAEAEPHPGRADELARWMRVNGQGG
jgi:hypothetical protein